MWTIAELKQNAKTVLKRTYWLSFAILLVAGIVTGIGDLITSVIDIATELGIFIPERLVLCANIFSLLVNVFIVGPIIVGKSRFFMQIREYDTEFSVLFSGFNGKEYWNNIRAMILKSIYIMAWSLLFFIPGIIKSYEYYFVSYIIAENPEIPVYRAFQISKEMTDGYKMRIFLLELSFVGWYLLGAFCLGIGVFFVNPYMTATLAELYAAQRAYVLSQGIVGEDELCGFGNYYNSERM